MQTQCCIAGGGPAGVMLGFLLARAGVQTVVLEKHADFFRDFRGDTVHPSTLQMIDELGLIDEFLKRPHQEVPEIRAQIGQSTAKIADFTQLRTRCKFIALMPQWDFLDFLAEQARRYPTFKLIVKADVQELIENDGRVTGVRAQTPEGTLEVFADLVVGADGRHSTVREKAGLIVDDLGSPMDVLWLRLTRRPTDPYMALGRIVQGKVFVTLDRGDYWQCAYVIPKGGYDEVRARGLQALHDDIVALAPVFADRVGEISDWDRVSLLTVTIDRLRAWHRPGLMCIGDAAHAMSPIGGVGINLAVQDAVAAANQLAKPLRSGTATEADLEAVQRRRTFPMRATQAMQVFMQNRVIGRVLGGAPAMQKVPFAVRLLDRYRFLRGITARVIGMGFRPEHIRTPEIAP